jgi:glucan 1,3-beta-glucosidase
MKASLACETDPCAGGNQQFTTRKFTFTNVNTAIDMLWDWGWTWKSLDISGATYGIKVSGAYLGGSILVLDSKMTNVVTGIYVDTPKGVNSQQHFSINIDNLVISGVGTAVKDAVAGTTLAGGSTTIVSWTQGRVYDTKNPSGTYQTGGALSSTHPKTASLMGGPQGGYFERSKPQYSDLTTNDFLNAKVGAKGILYVVLFKSKLSADSIRRWYNR